MKRQGVVCIERWSEWRGPWNACDVPLAPFSLLPPPALVSCPPLHPSSFALLSSNPSSPVTHGGSLLLLQNCLKLLTNRGKEPRRESTWEKVLPQKGQIQTLNFQYIYITIFLSHFLYVYWHMYMSVTHLYLFICWGKKIFTLCQNTQEDKKRDTA